MGKGVFKENGFKGGVKFTKDRAEVASLVEKMLGNHLVTHQTGSDGVKVEKVMIAESYNIVQEAYFAIVMDRDMGGPVLVCCKEGGVDIEELTQHSPHLICKVPIDISTGITEEQALRAATQRPIRADRQRQTDKGKVVMFFDLQYKLFNCEKFEINFLDNLTFHATTFSIILRGHKLRSKE